MTSTDGPKPGPKMVRVYPLPGAFVMGVRHVEQEVEEKRAKELVASRAFTLKMPHDKGTKDKE